MSEFLILVDQQDRPLGECEKIEAHQKGLLHRAFSVFLFNERGEWLLQRRNRSKYHSGGLWANAACGHPRPGEETVAAAERRLFEEMGIKAKLTDKMSTRYYVPFENGLAEHELVHLLVGSFDGEPTPNPDEVEEWAWVPGKKIFHDLERPDWYAFWFAFYLQEHGEILKKW